MALRISTLRSLTTAVQPALGFTTFNLDPSVNTPAQNSLYGGGVSLIKNSGVSSAWSNLHDVEVVSDERWT